MLTKMIDFFKPPEYDNIEQTQKARFLHNSLLISIVACLLIGTQNLRADTFLGLFMFLMAGISLLGLPLNKRGYFTVVAVFISALILILITFSLIDGIGLQDAGLIGYALFIIFTSFLFSKKAPLIATLLSLASVTFVYYLDRMGYLHPSEYSINTQLIVIAVLIIAAGFFLWIYMDNWERILKNLQDTYDLTLAGWGQALEYRDRETEGHSQRVVEMTIDLAKRLGVSGRELDHIRRGALLHDIGKMAVPDAILLKADRLSEAEWKVLKKHPLQATQLLENIPYLRPALDIPHNHHERWDGSGYPRGLLMEDIPLPARIFAIVDVWDALTSDRPYRKAWSNEKTRDYIRDQSGKLFDPQVVEVFLEYVGSGKKKVGRDKENE
jgi:HD-GYP domain-containing protein (c-di-GMP phosphodiesterase class II)